MTLPPHPEHGWAWTDSERAVLTELTEARDEARRLAKVRAETIAALEAEVERLHAELRALRGDDDITDARRYRWLRDALQTDGDDYDAFLSTRGLFPEPWPKSLDAAIDAALAQEQRKP